MIFVVWPALIWVYMLLAGVWARVGVARQVCGDLAPPAHILAHRLTSSRMVMEKSVKKENFSALIHHRFAMRRTTDMRMCVTSHVIVLVMRRDDRLTKFKYLKLYTTNFSEAWVHGSDNGRVSHITDHAKSTQHNYTAMLLLRLAQTKESGGY